MPHLIVEHSENISLKTSFHELVDELHYGFAKLETVKLEAVKTRTIAAKNSIVGDSSKKEFIFLRVLMLAGRSQAIKDMFSKTLTEILKKHIYSEKCCLCVELCELEHYYTEK